MANPREIGQEELHNRLKKLREQKDIITTVMEDMVRRVELAARRAANVTNLSEFLCHFVSTSGTMDWMYMKMFQAHVLLTQEDGFALNPDYLRAPMAITYSFQNFTDQIYARRAALEAPSSLPSISRPPSVASPHLSICDEMLGPRPALPLPPQSEPHAGALLLNSPGYAAPGGRQPVSAPPGAPEAAMAAVGPGNRPLLAASQQPLGYRNCEPQEEEEEDIMVPQARRLQPALAAGPGTRPLLAVSQPPLEYHDCEPQQEFGVPSAGAGRVSVAKDGLEAPHGALPKHSTPLPPVRESPKAPFVSGPSALPELLSQPTPGKRNRGAQEPVDPTGGAGAGQFEVPGCRAAPRAEAPERAVRPAKKEVAPPPVQSSSSAPEKPAEGVVKEDVRDQGNARVRLAQVDREKKCSQPQGEGKPANRKAGVPVPPGFTSMHKRMPRIVADMKAFVPDKRQPQLESVMAGRIESESPHSYERFTIPPADMNAIGTTQDVVVSFYKSPSEFWVQLEASAGVLNSLLDDLSVYYRSGTAHQKFIASVGMHCVARYVVDNCWYRVKILELLPDHAKVFYLDFGNCDRVPLTELSVLVKQFASLPVQAYSCSIKGTVVCFPLQMYDAGPNQKWPLSTVRVFRDMVFKDDVQLKAKFYLHDRMSDRFIVDLLSQTGDGPVANLSAEFITICTTESQKAVQVPSCGMERVKPVSQQPPTEGAPAAGEPLGRKPPAVVPPGKQGATAMAVPPATAILATGPPPVSTPPSTEPTVVAPEVSKPASARCPPRPRGAIPPARKPSQGEAVVVSVSKPAAARCPLRPQGAVPLAGGEPFQGGAVVVPEEPKPAVSRCPPRPQRAIPPAGGPSQGGAVVVPASKPAAVRCPPRPQGAVPTAGGEPVLGGAAVAPEESKSAASRCPLRSQGAVAPAGGASQGGAVAHLPRHPPPPGPTPVAVPSHLPPPGDARLPTIPATSIPDGGTFSFVLSVIFSPSDFYGQILTGNSTPGVMEELQQQLNQNGSNSSPPLATLVTKGTFWNCAHPADRNFYRTMVLESGNTNTGWRARVLYVDYGNRGLVELENLRPLPEFLAKLPACAHRMSLALVNPAVGNKWDDPAKELFLNETGFNTVLVAEKKGQHQTGLEAVAEVVLWNRNGPSPVNINILLVEKKLAQLKSP